MNDSIKYFDYWINFLRLEKGLKKNTVESYKSDLIDFFHSMNFKEYKKITEEDILRYIESLKEFYTKNSIYRKSVSIKSYFKFLYRKKYINNLPSENINLKQRPKTKIPDILTKEEFNKLIDSLTDDSLDKRDELIILFVYKTGVQITQILNLSFKDIDRENFSFVKIANDKNKFLLNIVDINLKNKLKHYIDNLELTEEDNIFLNISIQNFRARFIRHLKAAGINKKLSPSVLRNAFLSNLLDEKKEISVAKEELSDEMCLKENDIYNYRSKTKIKDIYIKIAIGDKDYL